MTVMINEAEWQKLKAERDALQAKLDAVMSYAPDCWEDSADPEDFVASLVSGTTTTPGHAADCDCWS